MEMAFKQVGTKLGISDSDISVIYDCVTAFPKNDITAHRHFIERVFLTDIKPAHYLVLGHLIGFLSGAEKTLENFYNNLQLCQRQN